MIQQLQSTAADITVDSSTIVTNIEIPDSDNKNSNSVFSSHLPSGQKRKRQSKKQPLSIGNIEVAYSIVYAYLEYTPDTSHQVER